MLGARVAARHRAPYVPVVQDLMGAAAAQSGIRGGGRAAELAERAESWVLRRATLVGVIHETFVERVRAMGVDPGRIRLVPNWSHIQAPSAPRDRTRERLGWRPEQTVVLHSGNMGLKQGLEVLVDAARRDPATRIVLMGDGNQREHLAALAEGLPNLEFLPSVDDADFPDVLAAADVLAVTQRASVIDMSVPSSSPPTSRAAARWSPRSLPKAVRPAKRCDPVPECLWNRRILISSCQRCVDSPKIRRWRTSWARRVRAM